MSSSLDVVVVVMSLASPSSANQRWEQPQHTAKCSKAFTVLNATCLPGNDVQSVDATSIADCCAICSVTSNCTHWTFDSARSKSCNLKGGSVDKQDVNATCTSGIPTPTPTPPAPPIPPPAPPNPDAMRPHILFVLADDLGWYDTQIYNDASPTPIIHSLATSGVRLDYHYVFRYCSPTRRSFLSGRLPNRISTVQPDGQNMCSNFLPLELTTLPEKLATAGYKSHHVGKGHEGYQTVDHLPINRGFTSHVGYLSGGPLNYFYGSGSAQPYVGIHDMWHDEHPGYDVVPEIFYSANFYATEAVSIVEMHNKSEPLFLYFPIQNVHSPYQIPPSWEVQSYPDMWDNTYANMLHMLDVAVGNVTDAFKNADLWDKTLMVFTADNGGVERGNNYPLRGHKHDPWEGGNRATAFITGGVVPLAVRGRPSGPKLVHVSDWYPTFCTLAGVDPRDTVYLAGSLQDIDGVNVWPMLTGENVTQPRSLTPTTEASIIDASNSSGTGWWKLVTLAGQSNYYMPNQTKIPGQDACLEGRQADPPQPAGPFGPGRTDPLVNGGCAVCNASHPCLYNLLDDPYEEKNVAGLYPNLISRLSEALNKSNNVYVSGSLPESVLAANYTRLSNRTKTWQGYQGPCYISKNSTYGIV